MGADLLVKELGNDARGVGISQVMPYPWNDTNPLVREYRKLMTTMGKQSQSTTTTASRAMPWPRSWWKA